MSPQFAIYPSLRDRIVLVTGGADGIGASLVEAFVLQGSKVIFLDISDDKASVLIDRLKDTPNTSLPLYHHCDLAQVHELKTTVERILETQGKVDVLVNNAGQDTRKKTEYVTPEFFDASVAINLKQMFFLIQAIAPGMQKAKSGSIINMGSITWAIPATGLPVYTSLKAAIMGLTKTHAHEFGKDGIRVNSIMPGGIATERQRRDVYSTPGYAEWMMSKQALKIELDPGDVARLALFFAADDSRAITAQSYVVDGGWI
jgi:NAD(P)-dependent dehydrogenase (short-subunit alcohol dehydrogenase family)